MNIRDFDLTQTEVDYLLAFCEGVLATFSNDFRIVDGGIPSFSINNPDGIQEAVTDFVKDTFGDRVKVKISIPVAEELEKYLNVLQYGEANDRSWMLEMPFFFNGKISDLTARMLVTIKSGDLIEGELYDVLVM